jgi:hypothetical protein
MINKFPRKLDKVFACCAEYSLKLDSGFASSRFASYLLNPLRRNDKTPKITECVQTVGRISLADRPPPSRCSRCNSP